MQDLGLGVASQVLKHVSSETINKDAPHTEINGGNDEG